MVHIYGLLKKDMWTLSSGLIQSFRSKSRRYHQPVGEFCWTQRKRSEAVEYSTCEQNVADDDMFQ